MKLLRTAVLFVGLMIVAACSPMTIKGDPAREAQAQHVLVLTIAGDLDGVVADMPPELDSPTTKAQLAEVRAKLPKTPPPAGRTVSFTRFVGTGSEVYTLVRLYEFPATVIVTQTQMTRRADGRWVVANFTFNSATPEQLKANDFTLSDKTRVHYAVLAAMVAVASFIVVTVGFALYRRRWGWAIFSLFGFVAFQLNWATGAWALQPLQFYFLGAAFVRAASPFAAWVFTVAFPLGAVLFWALRKNTPKPPKTPKKGKAARQPFVSTPDDFSPITAPATEPTGTSRPSE
jgi:hypothetical protein